MTDTVPRTQRSDAAANRERVLAAAARAIKRQGEKVPMAVIAHDAGVGVGTVYRHFPARADLLAALERRSYEIVLDTARVAAASRRPAIGALDLFFERTIRSRRELILPLHGGRVGLDAATVAVRTEISDLIDAVLVRGRLDGTIRSDATAVDVIVAGALLAQPLPHVSDWDELARRQARIALDGLAAPGTHRLPGRVGPGLSWRRPSPAGEATEACLRLRHRADRQTRVGSADSMSRWVYDFADGSKDMRELLGGKGANVAEMTRVLGADRVPAGFTITTEACVAYMNADREEPEGMAEQVAEALGRLEERAEKTLGDGTDPLLVSVRSGARESMPGMLDTVLNLGLNDESVQGVAKATENDRFAWDSYRRFVQMFGNVSRGISGDKFEDAIKAAKKDRGVSDDTELDVDALRELTNTFKGIYNEETGEDFPQDPQEQLRLSIRAVFDSWVGDRAVEYRRQNRIPDDWGTAVNVQQMVFGNKGDTSGSGVAFSRNEVTGAPEPSGDFLPNAQGEDVVSGVRTPRDISDMQEWAPDVHEQLMEILRTLEAHYEDMQDTEFTVEEGQLYMLQTRSAKRPAQAAVRFAVDAVSEHLLSRERALATIDPGSLDALLHPTFDPEADFEVLASGVSASPGAAKGTIVFSAADAVAAAEEGRDVILVRPFTDAEDVAGFFAAKGILTSEGGKASHAALVARGMGRPAVVGAQALQINVEAKTVSVNGRAGKATVLSEGDAIAIDGTKGCVTTDDVPLVEAQVDENFQQVLEWADELRRMDVRANADTPEDARRARELGAQGIGLCRTEHMFMAEDRQPKMRAMIMAETREARQEALAELLPLQQEDFEGLFEAMSGLPVTVRLLDPPLHEFLPNAEELAGQVERARIEESDDLGRLERLLDRVHEISEENPMLGTRGCRLGILYPEIYEMQVHAILRAAKAAEESPHPEIMIPLVDYEQELEIMRALVVRVGEEEGLTVGEDYTVGTMIELPRACFVADRIAKFADFFSFGTNDLTQTALGFSRDDVESAFVPQYMERKIIDRSPFETIDKPGVGWLVRLGAWVGREAHPGLKLGICGEHGGDPDSIEFFHRAGLDYVSCSPFRVPIARIAAAQAAVEYPIGRWD